LRVKLANLGTKTLLKRAMEPVLPAANLRRRKHAFQIPLDQWLAGPMHDFVRDVLLDKRARERGWIDTAKLEKMLPVASATDQPSRGFTPRENVRLDGQSTWTLLSLELWARAFLDGRPLSAGVQPSRGS
jgi:asparagine synthase (glutamine-hydrolysing)